jgi:hypothetical protein
MIAVARITNWGMTRTFPTCIGNVFIASRQTVEIHSAKAADEISKFNEVQVDFFTSPLVVSKKHMPPDELRAFPINRLRQMAKAKGIKGFFTMKKETLIQALGG